MALRVSLRKVRLHNVMQSWEAIRFLLHTMCFSVKVLAEVAAVENGIFIAGKTSTPLDLVTHLEL